jgi:sterol desaturase/sphingolipid hydroxylase (fatty acid hydroxylase superfamily)
MNALLSTITGNYRLDLSLYTLVGMGLVLGVIYVIAGLNPVIARERLINKETFAKKMQRAHYAANQKVNSRWIMSHLLVIFFGIIPFVVTLDGQPWWSYLVDIFVLLMVYDFFYYLTHRFLYHDSAFLGGPLKSIHAVHHQQVNPCRNDATYIHPIEAALGLYLFVVCIAVLSAFMGKFHLVSVIFAWAIYGEINLQNHTRWTVDRFPFKYLNYMSKMHHYHHAKFTGGNFALVSLFYDWLFGSYDTGSGYGNRKQRESNQKAVE